MSDDDEDGDGAEAGHERTCCGGMKEAVWDGRLSYRTPRVTVVKYYKVACRDSSRVHQSFCRLLRMVPASAVHSDPSRAQVGLLYRILLVAVVAFVAFDVTENQGFLGWVIPVGSLVPGLARGPFLLREKQFLPYCAVAGRRPAVGPYPSRGALQD